MESRARAFGVRFHLHLRTFVDPIRTPFHLFISICPLSSKRRLRSLSDVMGTHEDSGDLLEGLELQSLDPDSLFQALTSVEKVRPLMPLSILSSPSVPTSSSGTGVETCNMS